MKQRSSEAERLEADYLDRVRQATSGLGTDETADIVQSVQDHIEEAVNESAGEEVTLVLMAGVIERLGPPGSYVDESSPARHRSPPVSAPAPADLPNRQRYIGLFNRVWWAWLVGVIGLGIPVIELHICAIAEAIMIALIFSETRQWDGEDFHGVTGWAWTGFITSMLMFPIGLLQLASPLFVLLGAPIAIAMVVANVVVYWKIMSGASALVRRIDREDLAERLLQLRVIYLAATVIMIGVAIVVGVVFGIAMSPMKPQDNAVLQVITFLVLLPLSWVLGWFLNLRPISQVRQALTESTEMSYRKLGLIRTKESN